MLSLKSGFPFATVNNKIVYIDDDTDTIDNNFLGKYIDIGKNHKFQLVPPSDAFRLAIFAPSGAGKSTFCANLIKEYKKSYKKNKVYMISPTKDDDAYKDLQKQIQYIKIDDTLLTDPMDFTEFENCLIVFDDSEVLTANKEINKAIEIFRNQVLENGRKRKISVVVINHVAQNGPQTKKVLNECDLIVLFPKSNFNAVSKLCKTYYAFDKDTLEYCREVPSRWIVVKRTYPQAILSEHAIKAL